MNNSFKCLLKRAFAVILLFIACLSVFNGCTCNREKSAVDHDKVSVQKQQINIHIKRFEKDLFSLNLDSVPEGAARIKAHYGEFFYMFNRILKLSDKNEATYANNLKGFITDYYTNLNYKKVMEVYPHLKDIEGGFQAAFTIYKENFPKKQIPHIISYVSGWNNMIACSDTILAIGLDMFLGRDFEYYGYLQLPKYLRHTMQKEYILPLSMQEWAITQFEYKDSATNLLSSILYGGKVMYFAKKMLPETQDSILFGYRADQLKWCLNNEKQMWTYLLENKLLFSTDYQTINKLTSPAPFTYYFTSESPGRASVWLGYRIISSYMSENPSVTLAQLMKETDYQKILRNSKYKP